MDLQKRIIAKIADQLGITPQDVDMEAHLQDDLGLGPLEKGELFNALAEEFGITFADPVEVGKIHEIVELIEYIEDKMLEE